MKLSSLPFDEAAGAVLSALERHNSLVVVAEPGAGKTTRLPPLLAGRFSERIVVLEPRRIAARAAATRIAEERQWELGREVGYAVRFENKISRDTRVAFYTEGLFLQKLKQDPELKGVSAVILDEFHERSRHTDVALGLVKELQELSRTDLKLVIMSATLDAEALSRYLGDAPIVRVPGRTFPIEIQHSPEPLSLTVGPQFIDRVAEKLVKIFTGREARIEDVLVFLPGTGEIRRVREAIQSRLSPLADIYELHGRLALKDQQAALARGPRPRVVLSTNVAETSLTLDGIGTVIDTGLQRIDRRDRAGYPRLELERISLSSVTQRGGRAGRQFPGLNYRLWSRIDESAFPSYDEPEIERIDLASTILDLKALGVTDARSFSWFTPPPESSLNDAEARLRDLGATETSGRLTPLGQEMARSPLEPRLAALWTEAQRRKLGPLGARLAALLQERDFCIESPPARGENSDLIPRLEALTDRNTRVRIDIAGRDTVLRVAEQIFGGPLPFHAFTREDVTGLLAHAFADRLAKRRGPRSDRARLAGGKGLALSPQSLVQDSTFFFALATGGPAHRESGDAVCVLAHGLTSADEASLLSGPWRSQIQSAREVQIDEGTENLTVMEVFYDAYRGLPLTEPKRRRAGTDEAFPLLIKEATRRGILEREASELHARFLFVSDPPPNLGASPFEDLEPWSEIRARALDEIYFGEAQLEVFKQKSASESLWRAMQPATRETLEKYAPRDFLAPSGKRVVIHYPRDRAPFLEIRLQELFGLARGPCVWRDQVPVTLHLLGPNFRPVQVTQNLAGFWRGSYAEVRKELRARYPKHSWPEDPAHAEPPKPRPRRS